MKIETWPNRLGFNARGWEVLSLPERSHHRATKQTNRGRECGALLALVPKREGETPESIVREAQSIATWGAF